MGRRDIQRCLVSDRAQIQPGKLMQNDSGFRIIRIFGSWHFFFVCSLLLLFPFACCPTIFVTLSSHPHGGVMAPLTDLDL